MNPEKFEQLNKEDAKFTELKEKFEAWVSKDTIKNYGKAANFSERIIEKYPDYDDYILYHAFSGSGIGRKCSKFDFPGDDSVEKFIEEQCNNLDNNL